MKKSWLVAPIASAILLGNCTIAFADTTPTTSSNPTTVQSTTITTAGAPTTTSTSPAQSATTGTTTTPTSATSTPSLPSDPSVVPGDYCYDVAASAEDIQITVSVDNSDKAQLLTQYALDKIAQAKALLQNGNQALAQQLIVQIMSDQKSAMDLAGTANTTGSSTTPADNGATGDTVSTSDAQTINSQIGQNVALLIQVLNQIKDPQEQAALVKIIQGELQTLVTQLGQHSVQVNIYIKADNNDEDHGDHEGHHGHDHHGDDNQGDSGNNDD